MSRLISYLLCCCLFSCSSFIEKRTNESVEIAKGIYYQLERFPNSLLDKQLIQQLTISYEQNQHDLLVYTELSNLQLSMVGTSLIGLSLFELSWDYSNKLSVNSSSFIQDLNPLHVLADFQLVQLDLLRLHKSLPSLIIEEKQLDNIKIREFFFKDQLLISIKYENHTSGKSIVDFTHYQRGYNIKIKTLEISSL